MTKLQNRQIADEFAVFLSPMLSVDAKKREKAAIALTHPWITNPKLDIPLNIPFKKNAKKEKINKVEPANDEIKEKISQEVEYCIDLYRVIGKVHTQTVFSTKIANNQDLEKILALKKTWNYSSCEHFEGNGLFFLLFTNENDVMKFQKNTTFVVNQIVFVSLFYF